MGQTRSRPEKFISSKLSGMRGTVLTKPSSSNGKGLDEVVLGVFGRRVIGSLDIFVASSPISGLANDISDIENGLGGWTPFNSGVVMVCASGTSA